MKLIRLTGSVDGEVDGLYLDMFVFKYRSLFTFNLYKNIFPKTVSVMIQIGGCEILDFNVSIFKYAFNFSIYSRHYDHCN